MQVMKSHAKQKVAPSASTIVAPARSPDTANNETEPAASATARILSRREPATWVAALEAVGFWALILIYLWGIAPRATLLVDVASLALLGLIPVLSLVLHHDDPREIGLGFEGLRRSLIDVGTVTLAGTLVIGVVAAGMGWHSRFTGNPLWILPVYFLWGLLQQIALQAFVHRRLRRAMGAPRLAELTAALLFGTLHLPNPILTLATTLIGWIWCRLYTRAPSLWTLAASHALLASLLFWVVPPEWVHNLKIGPSYWSWH
jgi:membrane protease YdiL (CAAX protease family)